jgi:hypothetical protein
MCVIVIAASERPSPEMIAKMFQNNPHGAGIAWRDKAEDGTTDIVSWRKGLVLDEVVELAEKAPLPFVAHFRIPSCGGPSDLLTHPFPVEKDVSLALEGSTTANVLFHNGHWSAYRTTMMDASVRGGWKIPKGKWSDTRAMAWMAAHFGIGMLEFIDEKAVVFGPQELEIFHAAGWTKLGQGIWVSNQMWQSERVHHLGRQQQGATDDKDKEDPQSKQQRGTDSSSRMGAGDGSPIQSDKALTQVLGPVVAPGGSGGPKDPFEKYTAAVRLWKRRDIGKKSFNRARRAYEKWCQAEKKIPLPPPTRDDRDPKHVVH